MNEIHPLQRLIRDVFDPTQIGQALPVDETDAPERGLPTPDHLLQGHTLRDVFEMNAAECVDCIACMDSLCCLVETVLNGSDLAQMLPTFAAHIDECPSCHEEYHALLSILEAELQGRTHTHVPGGANSASAVGVPDF